MCFDLCLAPHSITNAHRRTAKVNVDYVGFDCPDYFVVGYGMDFNDEYRCMPFVGVLKPEAYGAPPEEEQK